MPQIDPEKLAVMRFMLEKLEEWSKFDAQFRNHVVDAGNRLYDLTHEKELPTND